MLINFLDPSASIEENIDSEKQWCIEHIFNRSTVFMLVSHNMKGGPATYPCTITSGDNPGKPCSFPFVFPDCSVFPKPTFCNKNTSSQSIEYNECILTGETKHWCSTKTHLNNSYIEREWGFCSEECFR